MKNKGLPNTAQILVYNEVYGKDETFKKRIDLIRNIPTEFIICEFSGINYESKPPGKLFYITDPSFQKKWVLHFVRNKVDQNEVIDGWLKAEKKIRRDDRIIIFNRASTLFAINELLLRNPCKSSAIKYKPTKADWLAMFKYYLCINQYIDSRVPREKDKAIGFEDVSAQMLFTNELSINENPILKLNRFVPLYKHLYNNELYGPLLREYLNDIGFNDGKNYLDTFSNLYVNPGNKTENSMGCHYRISKDDIDWLNKLDFLSNRYLDTAKSEFNLVEIKRSPFYKILTTKEHDYVLLDNQFLIDKIYDIFINEFFFNYLKPKGVKIEDYKGVIGIFFHEYASSILERTLSEKYLVYKSLDQLKVNSSKGERELADIYFRQNKRVMIGEIKVTNLTSEQFEGNIDSFFCNGRDEFYKRFGLSYLVSSVERFCNEPTLFEDKNTAERYSIFPVLVLNEKYVQAPIIPEIFKKEFDAKLSTVNTGKHIIYPLSLLHVSDLELMDENLKKGQIWEILIKTSKGLVHSCPTCYVLDDLGLTPNYKFDFFEFIKS